MKLEQSSKITLWTRTNFSYYRARNLIPETAQSSFQLLRWFPRWRTTDKQSYITWLNNRCWEIERLWDLKSRVEAHPIAAIIRREREKAGGRESSRCCGCVVVRWFRLEQQGCATAGNLGKGYQTSKFVERMAFILTIDFKCLRKITWKPLLDHLVCDWQIKGK